MPQSPVPFTTVRLFVLALRVLFIAMALGLVVSVRAEMDASMSPQPTPEPDAWLDDVTETLADHYRTDGEWSLELVRAFTPPTDAIIEVTEMPSKPASQMMLRLQVHALDGSSSNQTVFVRAKIWRDAWIAREPLVRESTIDPRLLEVRRVDVLRERDLVSLDAPTEDLFMTRSLPSGRLLSWRDVARRPLVRKGQMIEVAALDGTLAITMKALALEDGLAGELVRVRNTESRRDFAAVVTAQGQAVVHF